MKLKALFTEHPSSVDETYTQHMAVAASFGWRMLVGSAACFVHALVPSLFVSTGSSIVGELNERMAAGRRGRARHMSVEAPPIRWNSPKSEER